MKDGELIDQHLIDALRKVQKQPQEAKEGFTWDDDEPGRCGNCGFALYYTLIEGNWIFYTGDEAREEIIVCPGCGKEFDFEDIIPDHDDEA